MCEEHDDLSEEKKEYFAKSFIQNIFLTERYELMEIVI